MRIYNWIIDLNDYDLVKLYHQVETSDRYSRLREALRNELDCRRIFPLFDENIVSIEGETIYYKG